MVSGDNGPVDRYHFGIQLIEPGFIDFEQAQGFIGQLSGNLAF